MRVFCAPPTQKAFPHAKEPAINKEVTIAIIGAVAVVAAALISTLLKPADSPTPETTKVGLGGISVEQNNEGDGATQIGVVQGDTNKSEQNCYGETCTQIDNNQGTINISPQKSEKKE